MSHFVHPSRRCFAAAAAATLAAPAATLAAAPRRPRSAGGMPDTFPAHDREVVREVVGASHTRIDAVRELVTARPELAKVSWDWGFGDWESALGAASHMGRRDISELLMEHGARPNLFTFAMFGQVDVVRAVCEANPGIQRQLGPHGITLMRHARSGGDEARSVVDYLGELGEADVGQVSLAMTEDEAEAFVGDYTVTDAEDVMFHVKYHERRGGLTLARGEEQFRFLMRQDAFEFAPGGAPSVRIVFQMGGPSADTLTIRDGGLAIRAQRIG